jgi:hypothetical protein
MKDAGVTTNLLGEALTEAAKYAKDFGFSLEEIVKLKQKDALIGVNLNCPTCDLIRTGGMFIDAECAKHPKK